MEISFHRQANRLPHLLRQTIDPARWGRRFRSRWRSEEHTSELQSRSDLVCRLLLEKKKKISTRTEEASNRATDKTSSSSVTCGDKNIETAKPQSLARLCVECLHAPVSFGRPDTAAI